MVENSFALKQLQMILSNFHCENGKGQRLMSTAVINMKWRKLWIIEKRETELNIECDELDIAQMKPHWKLLKPYPRNVMRFKNIMINSRNIYVKTIC